MTSEALIVMLVSHGVNYTFIYQNLIDVQS